MQKYFSVILDQKGEGIPGCLILVTSNATGLPASLYEDDEVTAQSNPVAAGGSGEFSFNVEAGIYNFLITNGGSELSVVKVHIGGPSSSNGTNVLLDLTNASGVSVAIGRAVFINGNETFNIAESDDVTDALERSQIFITNETIANGIRGQVTSFGVISGLSGGVAGQLGYLSPTGTITATVPSTGAGDRYLVILGRWISSTKFFASPQLPILL